MLQRRLHTLLRTMAMRPLIVTCVDSDRPENAEVEVQLLDDPAPDGRFGALQEAALWTRSSDG
jgi:hypothetical protein